MGENFPYSVNFPVKDDGRITGTVSRLDSNYIPLSSNLVQTGEQWRSQKLKMDALNFYSVM